MSKKTSCWPLFLLLLAASVLMTVVLGTTMIKMSGAGSFDLPNLFALLVLLVIDGLLWALTRDLYKDCRNPQ